LYHVLSVLGSKVSADSTNVLTDTSGVQNRRNV